jgi:uncharacterized protein YbaP (TraB family)
MRLVTWLTCFIVPLAALRAETSVWKISRHGQTMYLGGTIHLLRATDLPLPAEFDRAFAASAQLVFETDLGKLQSGAMQEVVLKRGMFADGHTLDQVLSAEAWKVASTYAAKIGMPIDALKQLKPWLFIVTLAQLELEKLGVSDEGVDLRLYKRARSEGKKTSELEPFDQHIDYIVNLGAGHESEMVKSSVEDLEEMPTAIDTLIAAWKTGDLATIDKYMVEDLRTKHPAMHKELLLSRNNLWLPQIERMLTTPEVEFVLVGAGHLAGKDGLIAQLKAKGCVVEQVKAATPAKK